jgi:hypothetical protein
MVSVILEISYRGLEARRAIESRPVQCFDCAEVAELVPGNVKRQPADRSLVTGDRPGETSTLRPEARPKR